jgi:hypothetical protein
MEMLDCRPTYLLPRPRSQLNTELSAWLMSLSPLYLNFKQNHKQLAGKLLQLPLLNRTKLMVIYCRISL